MSPDTQVYIFRHRIVNCSVFIQMNGSVTILAHIDAQLSAKYACIYELICTT